MTYRILFFTLFLGASSPVNAQGESRNLQTKDLTLLADKSKRSAKILGTVDFDDWLKAVSQDDMQLLYKSKTPEFYVAVFRLRNSLIVWTFARKDIYASSIITIKSKLPSFGNPITARSQKHPSLNAIMRQSTAHVAHIEGNFVGELIVSCSVGDSPASSGSTGITREVFTESVPWTAKAEQAGADQPATKPADKVPAKGQPSTPTPKGGPR